MLALDDAGLLAEQRDGQFALGVEFQDTLGSDRQLRLAEVEPAGDGQEPRGLLGLGSEAKTTQLWARTVAARLGQRAVYSWNVQVPQT